MCQEPQYGTTYDRELLLTRHNMTDYLLMEGPRRRRAFWNKLTNELAYFLVQPYLPKIPLLYNSDSLA